MPCEYKISKESVHFINLALLFFSEAQPADGSAAGQNPEIGPKGLKNAHSFLQLFVVSRRRREHRTVPVLYPLFIDAVQIADVFWITSSFGVGRVRIPNC